MLSSGSRIGTYEIVSPLGAGGMGEVYRARDLKLGREVAIKVLPAAFASDPDRLARFQREAQLLAALNHPNIAAIYGLQETDETTALVLELVEGETLADRIARGPIPVDEALPIARQIAEALEAAHDHGIIHRDLKPANLKLTPDGKVKVLDFGLAKLAELSAAVASSSASLSPTVTSPAMMTGVGMMLGTAAYMSPEQAKGRPADKRADVWAFGCVLYEMLTGKRTFEGEDVAETLASVLKGEPDWNRLPRDVQPFLRHLLKGMLQRDRSERISSVGPALLQSFPTGTDAVARSRWPFVMSVASVLLAVVALAVAFVLTRPREPAPIRRTLLSPGFGQSLGRATGVDPDIDIARDGSRIAYITVPPVGTPQLWIRDLDQLQPVLIKTNSAARNPFFSPQGDWVGFVDGVTLKKVSATGGAPIPIATLGANPRGATWLDTDVIVFASGNDGALGLFEVPASGGEIRPITTIDQSSRGMLSHRWPEAIRGRNALLFTIWKGSITDSEIALLDLQSKKQRILLTGASHARYVPTGHLIYTIADTLRAQPFDLDTLTVHGAPVPVLPNALTKLSGATNVATAEDGSVVYFTGSMTEGRRSFHWLAPSGTATPLRVVNGPYLHPRLSPDGKRFVYTKQDEDYDLWMYDVKRGIPERLTDTPGADRDAAWSRDGTRIAFYSAGAAGGSGIFVIAADGTGTPKRLTTGEHRPISWSGNDQVVFVIVNGEGGTNDIAAVSVGGSHQIASLIATNANETLSEVSPDGQWLAYQSNEAGANAIYVRPYAGGRRRRISVDGGDQPFWATDGGTLYFRLGDQLMAVRNTLKPVDSWSEPERVFDLAIAQTDVPRNIDVGPDGNFLIVKEEGAPNAAREIVYVQNWFAELRRLVGKK
jgi:serine/threonine-protein kinase